MLEHSAFGYNKNDCNAEEKLTLINLKCQKSIIGIKAVLLFLKLEEIHYIMKCLDIYDFLIDFKVEVSTNCDSNDTMVFRHCSLVANFSASSKTMKSNLSGIPQLHDQHM